MDSTQDSTQEDDTYADETPFTQQDKDSNSGNVKQRCKRKQETGVEGSQGKAQKVGGRAKCWKYYDTIFLEEDGVKQKYGKCRFCEQPIKVDPTRNDIGGGGCTIEAKSDFVLDSPFLIIYGRGFREILDVDKHLREWGVHLQFCVIAGAMREKYDKYWGKYDKLNDFKYFAVLMDPTMKSDFLEHCFTKMIMYEITKENPMSPKTIKDKASGMVVDVVKRLHFLFKTYKERFDKVENNSASQESHNEEVVECDSGNDFLAKYLNVEESNSAATETELKRYLQEPRDTFTKRFDILMWWKQNAIRYPIISRMAKDILAIQISTVASESAFSTSGCALSIEQGSMEPSYFPTVVSIRIFLGKSTSAIRRENLDWILGERHLLGKGNILSKWHVLDKRHVLGKRHVLRDRGLHAPLFIWFLFRGYMLLYLYGLSFVIGGWVGGAHEETDLVQEIMRQHFLFLMRLLNGQNSNYTISLNFQHLQHKTLNTKTANLKHAACYQIQSRARVLSQQHRSKATTFRVSILFQSFISPQNLSFHLYSYTSLNLQQIV
ncbi:hypothetical protein QVD17_28679 [Tagetes erecta]|uniref:Transposase n=1 Tax=Tagetes erecta TaxID=13708 RepID=A0AAD8NSD9_TARER|nr:hypothetical protein QVD17_28679 [Tagetes erecta]